MSVIEDLTQRASADPTPDMLTINLDQVPELAIAARDYRRYPNDGPPLDDIQMANLIRTGGRVLFMGIPIYVLDIDE